jgi:hypothetical protein
MDNVKIKRIVEIIDEVLREKFVKTNETDKLWDNYSTRWYGKVNKKRERGERLELKDHVRGMIYSMMSSQTEWARIEEKQKDLDDIFEHYDPMRLKDKNPIELTERIKSVKCGSINTKDQMKALKPNIEQLQKIEKQYDNIEAFYSKIKSEFSYNELVSMLSSKGDYKLEQMGIPLVSEYLRNMGHDIPKPDRHTKRILGKKILGYSNRDNAQDFEVFAIIKDFADKIGKTQVYIDYLLWAYCANKYGEICTQWFVTK